MSTLQPETSKRKFKRKEEIVDPKKAKAASKDSEVEFEDGGLFTEFAASMQPKAKKEKEEKNEDGTKKPKAKELKFHSPTSVDDPLIEVSSYITMPKAIQKLIGAEGVPCGLITMAYGLPDCGKTTYANTALLSAQRSGGLAILLKTEEKYSLKRAAAMGLDVKKIGIFSPRTIEEAGDCIDKVVNYVKAKDPGRKVCIVWDSLAATPCENELKENRKEFSMDAAKAIRGMLRRSQQAIRATNVAIIIINQVYDNTNQFGEKTTPYGGKGAIYHSAMILRFVKTGRIRADGATKDDDFCGIKTNVEGVKNHLGQPFKTADFQIDWKGFVFDRPAEVTPEEFYESEVEPELEDEKVPEVGKKKSTKRKT